MLYADAQDAGRIPGRQGCICRIRKTCAKTIKFTMYITHVVSVCTFIHATPVLKFCIGQAYNQYIYRYVSCGFFAHPEILVSPHNRCNVAI